MLWKIILGALLASNLYASSFKEALLVYKSLIIINKIKNPPTLVYNPSFEVNAYANPRYITINQGMLSFLHNNDELAKVLSHELGHFYLHHNGSTISNEYAADKQGAYFMKQVGYNVCFGAAYLQRRNSLGGITHPSDEDRYKALGC